MHVHLSEERYGRVDQVPGLLYVATKFGCLYWFPFIPLGSIVVREDGRSVDEPEGVPIRMSFKSVIVAYFRAALVVISASLFLGGIVTAFAGPAKRGGGSAMMVATGVIAIIMYSFSYRLTHASIKRALELAEKLDISPEEVAQAFAKNGRIDLNAPPAESDADHMVS